MRSYATTKIKIKTAMNQKLKLESPKVTDLDQELRF
jgi:hypothetical protein